MIDENFDRNYQAGRAELNATAVSTLKHLGELVREAFAVLNRIEYAAPWTEARKKAQVQ